MIPVCMDGSALEDHNECDNDEPKGTDDRSYPDDESVALAAALGARKHLIIEPEDAELGRGDDSSKQNFDAVTDLCETSVSGASITRLEAGQLGVPS